MRRPHINDHVRLIQGIPELALSAGEVGIVRSTWFAPAVAYEVEFSESGQDCQTRALLLESQVVVHAECVLAKGDAVMPAL